MIGRLAQVRLSRLQLGLVALASAIATAVVIVDARPGRTPVQAAVLAALHRQGLVIHHVGDTSSGGGDSGTAGPGADPAGTAPLLSPGAAPAPSSASSATSSATGVSTTSTFGSGGVTSNGTTPTRTYKVKHVFVIALSAPSYEAAFGSASVAGYLNRTLVPKGTLLSGYRSLGYSELSDLIAMVSGQAPNADTSAGCPTYSEFPAGAKPDAAGLVPGDGCIYPDTALTVGDQVTGSGKVWKAYIDGMGGSTCVHPNSGAQDNTVLAGAGSEYDTRHNPFIYFHSLLDLGDCAADDEALTQLSGDLRSGSAAPAYAFLAPGLCDDSSQATCPSGQPPGLAGEDAFLKEWVPTILHSSEYKRGGALIVTFAISKPPTSPSTGATGPTGSTPGSGSPVQAGALVLSPYTTAGRTVSTKYDPYSVLRSVENLLGFDALGHAKQAKTFVSSALPHA